MKKLLSILLSLMLFGCSADALSIQWSLNDPVEQVTNYNIYVVKHTPTLVATVDGSTNHATIDSYLTGNRTTFYVTAVNVLGESLPSVRVTVQRH